jgi:SRSO17 transposase
VPFRTKPVLAQQMLERALDAGVPAAWVTGDEIYGGNRRLRMWLEERRQPFVLAVSATESLFRYDVDGLRQTRAATIAAALPAEAWQVLSAGAGTKGPRTYRWAWTDLFRIGWRGWRHALLVRERLTANERGEYERAYYVVFAPKRATLQDVVRVAGTRWAIEQGFEAAKQEVGLDEYEVRKYDGWYRYVTLALFAHAFLAAVRADAAPRERGSHATRRGRPTRRSARPRSSR